MFSALSNVVRAVTIPARTLALTIVLFVIVIYAFSIFGFYMYSDFRKPFGKDDNECQTFLDCWMTMMHEGLLKGEGAVMNTGRKFKYSSAPYDFGLSMFDLLFWIIVTIVLLNCVFGIMLDTFALLRDQQEQQRRVLNNQCFICCMERGDFESNAVFNKHCKFEHNLMHYVFYIHYGKLVRSHAISFFVASVVSHTPMCCAHLQ